MARTIRYREGVWCSNCKVEVRWPNRTCCPTCGGSARRADGVDSYAVIKEEWVDVRFNPFKKSTWQYFFTFGYWKNLGIKEREK